MGDVLALPHPHEDAEDAATVDYLLWMPAMGEGRRMKKSIWVAMNANGLPTIFMEQPELRSTASGGAFCWSSSKTLGFVICKEAARRIFGRLPKPLTCERFDFTGAFVAKPKRKKEPAR